MRALKKLALASSSTIDFELIGFPYALLVGKEFANGKVEFITRDGLSKETIDANDAFRKIKESL